MSTASTSPRARAWNQAELRRLGRSLADWAVAELTQNGAGPVRAADFERRARILLRTRVSPSKVPAWMRQLAAAGMRVNHPAYMAQQIPAPIPLAALVESAVSTLNQSLAVWDMSPAGTLVDRAVMDRFKGLLGFSKDAEGSLTPGGSFANLTALLAARAALDSKAWRAGGARIAILAGAHTHYSIARAAGILGLGADCVFPIAATPDFRTDPDAVPAAARLARRAGYRKFILVATSGSTPTGGFDDLAAFADQARKLGAWLHVDAAHGGGMAFSPRYKRLLRGLERADSVAFDPHKMMFMPLSAGAVLVRRGEHLRQAFEQHAPYLFSPPEVAATRPVGDGGTFTIACSQRFESLKIWLVWNAYGPRLFADLVESVCATTQAAYELCQASRLLEPVHRPQSNIFCFRLRQPPVAGKAADALHWRIKEAVNISGKAYISSTVLEGRRGLRLVVMNPRTTAVHMGRVLRAVEAEARRCR